MKHILVVDDNRSIRKLVCQMLSIDNRLPPCVEAENGLEAVQKAILNAPELVVMDFSMPVMNGFELLEQFKEILFAIIFTTSYDQYAIKAIHFSALEYLLKPVDPGELQLAIKKVEEKRHLPLAEQFQLLLKKINGMGNGFNKIAVPTRRL